MANKMERRIAYVGSYHLETSLGVGVAANYEAIAHYETHTSSFEDVPVCKITPEVSATTLTLRTLSHHLKEIDAASPRLHLILSTTKGEIEAITSDPQRALLTSLADEITTHLALANPVEVISNACISGVAAIIHGAREIERGEYDQVIIVGIDKISSFIAKGFDSFRSIDPTLCTPYDLDRQGLTLGEACGVLLLTADPAASPTQIIIAGGAISCDANHISGPSRTGDGLYYAMRNAMEEANLEPEEIDYVNLHGTGTPYNDEMESKAMMLAGLDATPCNSLKPYLGHTLGASGVIEAILTVEQMIRSEVIGTKGYATPGTPCPLNLSATHRHHHITHAIKTASGFGGTNAALILSHRSALYATTPLEHPTATEEVSHYELAGTNDFADTIRTLYKELGEKNLKFFKMDNLCKLGYVASCKLMQGIMHNTPSDRIAVILASRSGSLDTDLRHAHHIATNPSASPAIFVYTLANVVAAEIAIRHHCQGELMIFIEPAKAMDKLATHAQHLINRTSCDAVIYGWCELMEGQYETELKLIKRK